VPHNSHTGRLIYDSYRDDCCICKCVVFYARQRNSVRRLLTGTPECLLFGFTLG